MHQIDSSNQHHHHGIFHIPNNEVAMHLNTCNIEISSPHCPINVASTPTQDLNLCSLHSRHDKTSPPIATLLQTNQQQDTIQNKQMTQSNNLIMGHSQHHMFTLAQDPHAVLSLSRVKHSNSHVDQDQNKALFQASQPAHPYHACIPSLGNVPEAVYCYKDLVILGENCPPPSFDLCAARSPYSLDSILARQDAAHDTISPQTKSFVQNTLFVDAGNNNQNNTKNSHVDIGVNVVFNTFPHPHGYASLYGNTQKNVFSLGNFDVAVPAAVPPAIASTVSSPPMTTTTGMPMMATDTPILTTDGTVTSALTVMHIPVLSIPALGNPFDIVTSFDSIMSTTACSPLEGSPIYAFSSTDVYTLSPATVSSVANHCTTSTFFDSNTNGMSYPIEFDAHFHNRTDTLTPLSSHDTLSCFQHDFNVSMAGNGGGNTRPRSLSDSTVRTAVGVLTHITNTNDTMSTPTMANDGIRNFSSDSNKDTTKNQEKNKETVSTDAQFIQSPNPVYHCSYSLTDNINVCGVNVDCNMSKESSASLIKIEVEPSGEEHLHPDSAMTIGQLVYKWADSTATTPMEAVGDHDAETVNPQIDGPNTAPNLLTVDASRGRRRAVSMGSSDAKTIQVDTETTNTDIAKPKVSGANRPRSRSNAGIANAGSTVTTSTRLSHNWSLRRKHEEARGLVCFICNTTKSVLWRRTKDRQHHLCNSCGIRSRQVMG